MKKKVIVIAIAVLLVVAISVPVFWSGLAVTEYSVDNEIITEEMKLCVITDLHASKYGNEQSELIDAIFKAQPDAVFIVGDIIHQSGEYDSILPLLKAIGERYICFYVSGNHEYKADKADEIKTIIRSYGILVLEADTRLITINGHAVRVCGVDDRISFPKEGRAEAFENQLSKCASEIKDGELSILLSHRPLDGEIYSKYGFDIVLSGHNHGGQVRIPYLINGLYAPDDGFFPKLAGGAYTFSDTTIVVSRGLCKNWVPRVFNPPELVMVTVK